MMADDLKTDAIERLREATTNRNAFLAHIYGDTCGPDDMEPGTSFEDYLRAQNSRLQAVEDVAICVVGEVYRSREDLEPGEKYAEIRPVIEQAAAGWLYPVILERALEAVGGV